MYRWNVEGGGGVLGLKSIIVPIEIIPTEKVLTTWTSQIKPRFYSFF